MFNVYVKTDNRGVIVAVDSDLNGTKTAEWTQIDSGTGERYARAQVEYFSRSIITDDGVFVYKLVDGVPVERTNAEQNADFQAIVNEHEIVQLKQQLNDTDYIPAKIAEGAATISEYADEIAQRAAWRARINELGG